MTNLLSRLFRADDAKTFAKIFKEEVEKTYPSPTDFLRDATGYLAPRLYERYYQDTVPHSLFGLTSADRIQSFFPEDRRWRPFAQQSWFATRERKRTPLQVDAIPPKSDGSAEERWRCFEQFVGAPNFHEAFALAKGFLQEGDAREFFRQKSLLLAMQDSFQGGHKFVYLFQMWCLAESLQSNHTEQILAPALHFLIDAPKDHSLSRKVRERWERNRLTRLTQNDSPLSGDLQRDFEQALLFGEKLDGVFDQLEKVAASGVGGWSVWEALVLAAARAIANSDAGEWIWPVRAFHCICFIREWQGIESEEQQTYILMMAAALLHEASRRSREVQSNRELDEVARRLCPVDPFNVLRSVISHTDPYASATAVYAIVGMEENKREELFRVFADQAVKNDGEMCYGHDLLLIDELAATYKQLESDQKDILPIIGGFFLGRVRKKYELFGAYGF